MGGVLLIVHRPVGLIIPVVGGATAPGPSTDGKKRPIFKRLESEPPPSLRPDATLPLLVAAETEAFEYVFPTMNNHLTHTHVIGRGWKTITGKDTHNKCGVRGAGV
jgi:hypothetical protein